MAKFDIPRFKYLFQDKIGYVWLSTNKPDPDGNNNEWYDGCNYKFLETGTVNTNWRNTLIDLDLDDYEFEDGILRRIEK